MLLFIKTLPRIDLLHDNSWNEQVFPATLRWPFVHCPIVELLLPKINLVSIKVKLLKTQLIFTCN